MLDLVSYNLIIFKYFLNFGMTHLLLCIGSSRPFNDRYSIHVFCYPFLDFSLGPKSIVEYRGFNPGIVHVERISGRFGTWSWWWAICKVFRGYVKIDPIVVHRPGGNFSKIRVAVHRWRCSVWRTALHAVKRRHYVLDQITYVGRMLRSRQRRTVTGYDCRWRWHRNDLRIGINNSRFY